MKKILFLLVLLGLSLPAFSADRGLAYKQSIKILQMATDALEDKIRESTLDDFDINPERREILQYVLRYDNLRQRPYFVWYRHGKKLEMNYSLRPQRVTIYRPYYQAFDTTSDSELEMASLEVQKKLLTEAAHIWGYDDNRAGIFSVMFLNNADNANRRPTNAIIIKNNFCSCIDGKADSIGDCSAFCAVRPVSSSPILFVNTVVGPEIAQNKRLGNLYNWCTVQLPDDYTTPQCVLNATDGETILNLPVNLAPGSNSFTANISALAKNHIWIFKLVENKTGSNAQSLEAQMRRISE